MGHAQLLLAAAILNDARCGHHVELEPSPSAVKRQVEMTVVNCHFSLSEGSF